ncbi:MAG TPA: nitroreductase/quinone reductase family protein [Acidimicrobiia bacterium]|jgi:deazaflavin-dependent oxidoreductase (nitroreductase family)
MLDARTAEKLARTRTVDLVTTGRRSGRRVTVEIWMFHFEDRFIITGTPGVRDWLANIRADPAVTIQTRYGDFPAVVREVADPGYRRRFFMHRAATWYSTQAGLDELVDTAPMLEVDFNRDGPGQVA